VNVNVVISSPPYADNINNQSVKSCVKSQEQREKHNLGGGQLAYPGNYGTTEGQLGAMHAGEPMSTTVSTVEVPTQTWQGCYDDTWKGIITPESFAHPAKFARGLIERILDFMIEQGWLAKDMTVLDPFGGVGLGGICAASRGIRWAGCELEERFVKMAEANFEKHRHKWEKFGDPLPCIVQGDSRRLREVLTEAGAVVSSPPYSTGDSAGPESLGKRTDKSAQMMNRVQGWGTGGQTSDGNLAALPPGSVEACLRPRENADGLISSPPYEASFSGNQESTESVAESMRRRGCSEKSISKATAHTGNLGYGSTDGQLGSESGDTFWEAAKAIVTECWHVLRPGSYAAWIVKDFVRDSARVEFSKDWLRLCCACGFTPVLWVKASLVKTEEQPGLFGGKVTKKTKKAIFFRRLHEGKLDADDPRIINEEVVLFCRRD
jgi:hypothetical protein